jgi:hypothetical protein
MLVYIIAPYLILKYKNYIAILQLQILVGPQEIQQQAFQFLQVKPQHIGLQKMVVPTVLLLLFYQLHHLLLLIHLVIPILGMDKCILLL